MSPTVYRLVKHDSEARYMLSFGLDETRELGVKRDDCLLHIVTNACDLALRTAYGFVFGGNVGHKLGIPLLSVISSLGAVVN